MFSRSIFLDPCIIHAHVNSWFLKLSPCGFAIGAGELLESLCDLVLVGFNPSLGHGPQFADIALLVRSASDHEFLNLWRESLVINPSKGFTLADFMISALVHLLEDLPGFFDAKSPK